MSAFGRKQTSRLSLNLGSLASAIGKKRTFGPTLGKFRFHLGRIPLDKKSRTVVSFVGGDQATQGLPRLRSLYGGCSYLCTVFSDSRSLSLVPA